MKALTIEMPYGEISCYYFNKSETEPYTLLESYEAEDIRTKAPLVFGISNYHHEWWDWYGVFYGKDTEWNWHKWDCGHFSCYWPLEYWYSWVFTQDEIAILMKETPDILEYATEHLFTK